MNFTTLIIIPIAFMVLYIGATLLWNKKYRPWRIQRGKTTDRFAGSFNRLMKFIIKEDDKPLIPKVKNPKLNKFLTWNTFYILLIITTIGMLAFDATIINAWIPALILIVAVTSRAPKTLKARHQSLTRMFIVANSTFHYPRGAESNPWSYIKVKQWTKDVVPGETTIQFDPSFAATPGGRDGFETHFSQTVAEDTTWVYEWNTQKSFVTMKPVKNVPTKASYPGSETHEWNKIPLGVGPEGEVFWDVSVAPHAGVFGRSGGGKSVAQRNIVFHCIQHSDKWCFLGVDPKKVELKPYAKYTNTVLGIATTLEDMVEVIRYAKEEMMRRYETMEAIEVNNFKDLPEPPRAIMLMIDEAYMLMAAEGVKTDEGKQNDELHGEATVLIGEILRLGRAAGVHIALAMQRPDATVLKGEFKNNLEMRIVAGRYDGTASAMALDNGLATRIPSGIKGRGVAQMNGDGIIYQGYFADPKWMDDWLLEHPEKEPEVYAKLVKELPTAPPEEMFSSDEVDDLNELSKKHSSDDIEEEFEEITDDVEELDPARFNDSSDFLPENAGRVDDVNEELEIASIQPEDIDTSKYEEDEQIPLIENIEPEPTVVPKPVVEAPAPVPVSKTKKEPKSEINDDFERSMKEVLAELGLDEDLMDENPTPTPVVPAPVKVEPAITTPKVEEKPKTLPSKPAGMPTLPSRPSSLPPRSALPPRQKDDFSL